MTNRAVFSFFAWLEQHGIGGLVDIEPFHVAAYIKALKCGLAGGGRTIRTIGLSREGDSVFGGGEVPGRLNGAVSKS